MLAAVTIPLITNLAIGYFDADGDLGLQVTKVVQVIAIVLVPVAIGMVVRHRSESFAARADRPVRVFSIVVLAAVAIGAILGERENIVDYLEQVGLVTALLCLISLSLGYAGARLFRLDARQAIASSMEVGIHNRAPPDPTRSAGRLSGEHSLRECWRGGESDVGRAGSRARSAHIYVPPPRGLLFRRAASARAR